MRLKPLTPREGHPEDVQRVMAKKSADNFEIPKILKIKNFDFPDFFGNFVIQSPKAGPAPRVNLVQLTTRLGTSLTNTADGFLKIPETHIDM